MARQLRNKISLLQKGIVCLSYALLILCSAMIASCGDHETKPVKKEDGDIVTYPEKSPMRLLTDWPPQLETPLSVFKEDFTPNEYFFVRWHLSRILTKIDIDTFRLYVEGAVEKPLALSLNDLKTKFPHDSIIAVAVCAGNSRSSFNPKVPGSQWRNGGMGNAKWKGVKLKYILSAAGLKKGVVDVTFQGMDKAPLPQTPAFIKSLDVNHATDGEVMIAYEMNGQPIPMLNGYPLKLVVPGWYATYWVGSLNAINVLTDTFDGFWMTKAYRVNKDGTHNESPDSLAQNTVPISHINMHSIFVSPGPDEQIPTGKTCTIEGLAFDDGTGIKKVELSFDDGKTWTDATLNPEIGKYSWRRWKYNWVPKNKGKTQIKVRATDNAGRTQPEKQWNRSGYARGFIEQLSINVN